VLRAVVRVDAVMVASGHGALLNDG
jgi:hypothetical protein